jgi:hypothetical protein
MFPPDSTVTLSYYFRSRDSISTSDHPNRHHPPITDVVSITIATLSHEEQERQRQFEDQERTDRQYHRQREVEERERETKTSLVGKLVGWRTSECYMTTTEQNVQQSSR